VRQIAIDMELNANAVSRMFSELESEGYLMYREGAGFYCIDLREKIQARRGDAFDV
jgi:DNA-binding transcriptional regulator YhcF (GntR family)